MDNLIIGSIIKIRNQGQGEMDYWFDEEKTLNRTFSKFLNTPRFTSGELPVSYRVLNHWGNLGILPEGINNNGSWRKFTFVERVWIGVASHLRDFGFPLEKIAEVRKHILKYNKKIKAYYHFEYYIVRALASSDDTYVIVLNDGTADVGNQEEIEINIEGERWTITIEQ